MKKFLSFVLAAAMLLSMIIVVSLPTAAVDGDWVVYTRPSDYGTNDDGTPKTPVVAGYQYTADGFTTVDADWTNRAPFLTVQTRNKVNVENGIYLKVCVDRYAYEDNDAWVNFSFWDSQNIEPGQTGYGKGVQTLIRPTRENDESEDWFYSEVQWWDNEWHNAGKTPFKDAEGNNTTVPVVDGKATFEVELKRENGAYTLSINGAQASEATMAIFSAVFSGGEAYVGISLHNTTYDSVVGLTILAFGTSREDAVAPDGTDYADPINVEVENFADIADPSTVPEGQPAILMTGNKETSDTKSISANQGDTYTINDDFSVRVADTSGERWSSASFKVKDEVSYDIDDFPVLCFLTRDYCNCDDPEDCWATEECGAYIMAGKGKAPASGGCEKIPFIDICDNPIIIEDGDNAGSYLYFWYDTSSQTAIDFAGGEGSRNDWTGRIHGAQLEFSNLSTDATRNIITFEWVGFFRTLEEAEAYVFSYLGVEAEDDTTETPADDTTEAPADDTTEADAGNQTEADAGNQTEADAGNQTEADAGNQTEADAGNQNEAPDPAKKGCGSVIGVGAFAVVALVATCGAVVLKKKEN